MKPTCIHAILRTNKHEYALCVSLDELSICEQTPEHANQQVAELVRPGDTLTIAESRETLTVTAVERFGQFLYPNLYDKQVKIIVEHISNPFPWYVGKTLQKQDSLIEETPQNEEVT